ncbi:MAG: hypothetical protein PWR01_3333 [Clostridiales bacterium]|jgi:hypothetical protein|nr:hypothetical protein [Clostridiales bacterium]MDN5282260.1 hypothetical protein [Candidatus Ozemobacter sp.]
MKLSSSAPQIKISSLSNQSEAINKAAQLSNRATTAQFKAQGPDKSKVARQTNEMKKSSDATLRNNFNQRIRDVKSTTAQVNAKTRESGKDVIKVMASVISPPGHPMPMQQLGQFIDKFA